VILAKTRQLEATVRDLPFICLDSPYKTSPSGEADIIGPTSPAREPLAPGLAFLLPTPATNVDAAPSSPNSAAPPRSPRRASSAAADRFRASVNRVVQMQRMSTLLQPVPAGAEPGVDPRRVSAAAQYSHIRTDCNIEVSIPLSPPNRTYTLTKINTFSR
jgi:hypothetical protein